MKLVSALGTKIIGRNYYFEMKKYTVVMKVLEMKLLSFQILKVVLRKHTPTGNVGDNFG